MTETIRMRIFAGPNGSGKSTIKDMLPAAYLGHYLNPDELERQLSRSAFFPIQTYRFGQFDTQAAERFFLDHPLIMKANLRPTLPGLRVSQDGLFFDAVPINSYIAAVLTDWLRWMCIQSRQSFTFETVMSSADKIAIFREAKRAGFRTYLYYVATDDPAINLARVRSRVAAGGHTVPADKIVERYYRSLSLLPDAIRLSDRAYIFDNSGTSRLWVAEVTDGINVEIMPAYIPAWFVNAVLAK